MNKKRSVFMLVTLSLMVLMLLVVKPNNSLANEKVLKAVDQENNQNVLKVVDEESNKNVVNFVSTEKAFFDLQGPGFEAELVRELYHSDDSVLAYYYQIKDQGKLKGFVLASAKENIDFILEYGQFTENVDTKYADLLLQNLDEKAYFLGLDFIMFANNKDELTKLVDQKKEEVIENAIENGESAEYIQEIKDTEPGLNIDKMEYSLKSNLNSIEALAIPDSLSLDGFTRIYQRAENVANPNSSCGPASGAMIANYYGEVRGFNVKTTKSYLNDVGTFINHLYYDMNSLPIGTNSYSFLNGLSLHLNHNVNQWEGVRNGEPTFANVINAINQSYPVAYVTRLGNEDYHWRVIKGYQKTQGKVIYKDPDGSKSNSGDLVATWSLIQGGITTVYFRTK